METAVAVGMSTGMMMLIGVLMFWFRKTIFRAAELSEVTVTRILDGVDDSSGAYLTKLHLINAQTRAETFKEISELEVIVSNEDLMELLKSKSIKPSKKPQAQTK